MNVLSKCADGSAVRAYSILIEMKARGIQPNLVSYNTVIDAQARRPDGFDLSLHSVSLRIDTLELS